MSSFPATGIGQRSRPLLHSQWMYWPLGGASLFGVLYAFAILIKHLCADETYGNSLGVLGKHLLDPDWIDISQTVLILLCAALAWFAPRLGLQQFQRIESVFSRVANHRPAAV